MAGDTPWRIVDWSPAVGAGSRAGPDVPGVPSAEELSALPHAELAWLLAEAYRVAGQSQARVEQLERRPGKDSSKLADDPDERLEFSPACCLRCGAGLDGEPGAERGPHQRGPTRPRLPFDPHDPTQPATASPAFDAIAANYHDPASSPLQPRRQSR